MNNMSLKSNRDYYTTVQLQVRPQNQSHDDQSLASWDSALYVVDLDSNVSRRQ